MQSWHISERVWKSSVSCLSYLCRNPEEFCLRIIKPLSKLQKIYTDHGSLKILIYFLILEIMYVIQTNFVIESFPTPFKHKSLLSVFDG